LGCKFKLWIIISTSALFEGDGASKSHKLRGPLFMSNRFFGHNDVHAGTQHGQRGERKKGKVFHERWIYSKNRTNV
jgi:hypothetical protein